MRVQTPHTVLKVAISQLINYKGMIEMSTIYQVRTPDKHEVLSSGLTPEQAVEELCNDYGVALPEISHYLICRVTQEHRVSRDLGANRAICRLHERITNYWSIGGYFHETH